MESGKHQAAGVWDWPLQHNNGMVIVHNDGDRFEADLEMPMFRENEINVNVINDEVVVQCYQEQDAGRIPREIHRTYVLPSDVDLKTLKSMMKTDGILQIVASKKRIFV